MSPEQALGKSNIDFRSDLYSLAVVAFHCITGRLPFESEALGELIVSISMKDPPLPSTLLPLPPGLDSWFKCVFQKDPNARFRSAKEMAELFVAACRGDSVPAFDSTVMASEAFSSKSPDVEIACRTRRVRLREHRPRRGARRRDNRPAHAHPAGDAALVDEHPRVGPEMVHDRDAAPRQPERRPTPACVARGDAGAERAHGRRHDGFHRHGPAGGPDAGADDADVRAHRARGRPRARGGRRLRHEVAVPGSDGQPRARSPRPTRWGRTRPSGGVGLGQPLRFGAGGLRAERRGRRTARRRASARSLRSAGSSCFVAPSSRGCGASCRCDPRSSSRSCSSQATHAGAFAGPRARTYQ